MMTSIYSQISTGNAIGNGVDFESDTLIAVFNPGDSQVDVIMSVIRDQIVEPTEKLNFNHSVPDDFSNVDGRLLVIPDPIYTAVGEIIDSRSSDGKYLAIPSINLWCYPLSQL